MRSRFKLSDSVLARIVQVIQEGMILGVDVVDIMRQIELQPDDEDSAMLVMSPEYQQQVKDMHDKYVQQAQELQAQSDASKLVILGGNAPDNN